jgi:FtsZ-binding cell division protein ZapB
VSEIEELKDQNKMADVALAELKEQRDFAVNTENNRVQFLREKGGNFDKLMQDDKLFQ